MRTILLDATYEPLGIISWHKAFRLLFESPDSTEVTSKADILWAYQDRKVHSPNAEWDWPSIIILRKPSNRKRQRRQINPSTKSILVRDLYTCQYCKDKLSNKSGTKDHVIPESKGGPSSWENLVACCRPCQMKKADLFVDECGMYPIRKPKAPTFEERFFNGIKISSSYERKSWKVGLKKLGLDHLIKKVEAA